MKHVLGSNSEKHRHSVWLFLFDSVDGLSLSGTADVFSCANNTARGSGLSYDVRTVSVDGAPVRTSSGLQVTPDACIADVTDVGTLIVPGTDRLSKTELETVRAFGRLAGQAQRVASVSTGAFLLAQTGLLDGRKAVTHWALAEEFTRRFPLITSCPSHLVVTDGHLTTSGGAASGLDLALSLVEADLGRDIAQRTAQLLVTYLRTPGGQAQFAELPIREARSSALRAVQLQVIASPGDDWSLRSLAYHAGLSGRHVTRLFRAEIGMTAREFVECVRVTVAARMLIESHQRPDVIARKSGFGTEAVMRKSFLRLLQIPPTEYRTRFS
ncbi:GlxA family transcriptional regulator [Streptomyces rimosus]|uniref:GlxA family transcriptional regulator n=1 Tax=Streptomyces rimosus TaxID=1927 RepID=UPI000517BD3E|nr:DJ-1/PfpI family protein [Streptomyces rimosus]